MYVSYIHIMGMVQLVKRIMIYEGNWFDISTLKSSYENYDLYFIRCLIFCWLHK